MMPVYGTRHLFLMVALLLLHPDLTTANAPSPAAALPKRRPMAAGVYNLTYKSTVDESLQSLLVRVPRGYTPAKEWPLLVTLHGFGDGPILADGIDSMIQIGPSGRGSVEFTGIGERDVFECIEVTKRLLSVDEERLYLCGFSMGASATFTLGLKYPHVWAACVPVCGRCPDERLIANARHLPFWIHAGGKDIMVPPRHSRSAHEQARSLGLSLWQYTEHPNMPHAFNINWAQVETWLLKQQRVEHPREVTLRTRDLSYSRAHWIEIGSLQEYGELAHIEAKIEDQTVTVQAANISSYTLHLNDSLIDLRRPVHIIENGLEVFRGILGEGGRYTRSQPGSTAPHKRPGCCGPLWDIYSAPCVLVYGTQGKDQSVTRAVDFSSR